MSKHIVIVKGLVLNKVTNKILLLKRSPTDPVDPMSWETIGGKIEKNESLEEALIREIHEESGLSVLVKEPLYALTLVKGQPAVLIAYLCETLDSKVMLSEEHIDFKWVGPHEFEAYISGDILRDFKKYEVEKRIWNR